MLLSNFYVLPALSSQHSVFSKLCIINTLLHFLLLCQLCPILRNEFFGGRILGFIKSDYHDRMSMMTSLEGSLFSLASGPPYFKPTTDCIVLFTAINGCNAIRNKRYLQTLESIPKLCSPKLADRKKLRLSS